MVEKELLEDNDEGLEGDDEGLDSEFDEIAAIPPKKRSKLKWLLIIIILILSVVSVLFGLNKFGYINLPINHYLTVEKLLDSSDDTIKVEPEEITTQAPLPPPPDISSAEDEPVKEEPAKIHSMKGKYFLKVGSCLYKACRKELNNRIKKMNLPLVIKERIQSTTYYEIISDSSYSKKRAEEKLRLVNKYNETISFPYLLPTKKGRYVISFGQFPLESNAIQMKSQLEHLYTQIHLRFNINPRKDNVSIAKFYIGPYDEMTAKKIRQQLKDSYIFEWIEMTSQL